MTDVVLLRESLQKEKLLYIVGIILDIKDETLDQLTKYKQNDLVQILRDIHNNGANEYKIKTAHRYKFAKFVYQIAFGKTKISKQTETDIMQLLHELRKENLIYILDIVLDTENQTLNDLILMQYTQHDLVEMLRDINDNNTNKHKIKIAHRYKFAKYIYKIISETPKLNEQTILTSEIIQILLIIKEEKECIDSIQIGQQFMKQNVIKMNKLIQNSDTNNKNIKQKLNEICNLLTQQIDIKQTQILNILNNIHNCYFSQLNIQNQTILQCAQSLIELDNIYQYCFTTDKMTILDRKQKLISTKNSIDIEINTLMKLKDLTYNIDIISNNNIINRFFEHCFNLSNIHIDILPSLITEIFDFCILKWKVPNIPNELMKILSKNTMNKFCVKYEILYRNINNNNEWYTINNLINITEYNINKYIHPEFEVKINYTINNLFKSADSIIDIELAVKLKREKEERERIEREKMEKEERERIERERIERERKEKEERERQLKLKREKEEREKREREKRQREEAERRRRERERERERERQRQRQRQRGGGIGFSAIASNVENSFNNYYGR